MTFHIGHGLAYLTRHPVAEFLGGAFGGRFPADFETVGVGGGNHAHCEAQGLRGTECR